MYKLDLFLLYIIIKDLNLIIKHHNLQSLLSRLLISDNFNTLISYCVLSTCLTGLHLILFDFIIILVNFYLIKLTFTFIFRKT